MWRKKNKKKDTQKERKRDKGDQKGHVTTWTRTREINPDEYVLSRCENFT